MITGKCCNIEYALIRSSRKTLALYVKPDGSVEARAPLRLSKRAVDRFVLSKAEWIAKKRERFAARGPAENRILPPEQYPPGAFEQTAYDLVGVWEQRLGVKTTYVGFREMTSRWGSCTAKTKRIRLNTALKYCPPECLEYVVVHELAHLLESNHSPRFWAIVEKAVPDYKARQKTIKSLCRLLEK